MYKLPMIAINRTGYQRQGDRLNSLHNEVKYEISPKRRLYERLTPVPIDISYDVSVIAPLILKNRASRIWSASDPKTTKAM